MSQIEERQKLLSEGGGGGESGDEHNQPAPTLPPLSVPQPPVPQPPVTNPPPMFPVSYAEPPPEYTPLVVPKYQEYAGASASGAGIPVEVQVEGRTVQATLVQEPSGKHMVYICDRQEPAEGQRPSPPNDYLLLALLGLVCCCFPLGIIALVKSLEVNYRFQRGDYQGALRASKQAHSWGSAAVVFGVCVTIIYFSMKLYFHNSNQQNYYYS